MRAEYFIEDGSIWVGGGFGRPMIVVSSAKCVRGFRWYSSILGRAGQRTTFIDRNAALSAAAKTLGINIAKVPA